MGPGSISEINGARLHFVKKRTFSYRKWGLAPFISCFKENFKRKEKI
jgi:hypothetical protein